MKRMDDVGTQRAHARVAIAALTSLYSTESADERGLAAVELDGMLAMVTAAKDSDMNRVIGLGLFRPASAETIDKVERLYGRRNVPFSVQLHPDAAPTELPSLLQSAGLKAVAPWTVLARNLDEPPADQGKAIEVEKVSAKDADLFGSVIVRAFGIPFSQKDLFTSVVGRRGWSHYVASTGGTPIAAAWMYVHEGAALLAGSGTLPDARGRGAQRALTAHRLRDAAVRGAGVAFLETQATWDEGTPPELRNAERLGFAHAFELRSFVYSRGFRQVLDSRIAP
jgi:GNAT superfamily N-acetyltransferase